MVRIGLTGGIGSGKSTASARWADRGAVIVDADVVAREVVAPGTPALAAIRARFGDDIIARDGALDRPALGRRVFADASALRDLESITHPAIWARTDELMSAAGDAAIVVHDMPLLVEKSMGPGYHLVVVVDADEPTRVRRLVDLRGMSEREAADRVAAQATDEERRAAADVLVANGDGVRLADFEAEVDALWAERVVPFAANIAAGVRVRRPDDLTLSVADPQWASQGQRLVARLAHLAGDVAVRVDHIGSTAVPGLIAKDVIDLQIGVRSLADADAAAFIKRLTEGGFPRVDGIVADHAKDESVWPKRFHGSCDPGRIAQVHVREVGSAGWRWALAFRDWLRADSAAREEYAALKRDLSGRLSATEEYAEAKEPWFADVHPRLREWTAATHWTPPAPTA